jgi:hypothetical protein
MWIDHAGVKVFFRQVQRHRGLSIRKQSLMASRKHNCAVLRVSSHTGMECEAKNKFSENSATIAVLYAFSPSFFSVTENVNLLLWLLTIKGCSLV